MICRICKKKIVLVPSAAERAKKFGGTPNDYTKLFTTHTKCFLAERHQGVLDLIGEKNAPIKVEGGSDEN